MFAASKPEVMASMSAAGSGGRVQIYDATWHFLRGGHVGAHGGDSRWNALLLAESKCYTGRDRHHYSYAEDGELISAQLTRRATHRKIQQGLASWSLLRR